MALKHAYQSPTANNPAEEVSATRWNEAHAIDDEGIVIPAKTTTEAATPAAGNLTIYSKNLAGRIMPKWVGPSGLDTPFQAFLGGNRVMRVQAGSATAATTHAAAMGTAYSAAATTYAIPTIGTGSLLARTRRWTQATTTTAGSIAYHRSTVVECTREAGFFYMSRFFLVTMVAGNRGFFGLTTSAGNPTNIDPIAATAVANGHIGMAFNLNTGNWKLTSNTQSTIPTVLDLGASFPLNTTGLMELALFQAPGSSSVGYRITNLTTGDMTSGTISANLPTATVGLAVQNWMTNNATAATNTFGMTGWYLETDY